MPALAMELLVDLVALMSIYQLLIRSTEMSYIDRRRALAIKVFSCSWEPETVGRRFFTELCQFFLRSYLEVVQVALAGSFEVVTSILRICCCR